MVLVDGFEVDHKLSNVGLVQSFQSPFSGIAARVWPSAFAIMRGCALEA